VEWKSGLRQAELSILEVLDRDYCSFWEVAALNLAWVIVCASLGPEIALRKDLMFKVLNGLGGGWPKSSRARAKSASGLDGTTGPLACHLRLCPTTSFPVELAATIVMIVTASFQFYNACPCR
jgi:hypothetical protein